MIAPWSEYWTSEGIFGAFFVNLLVAFIGSQRMLYGIYLLVACLVGGQIALIVFPVFWVILQGFEAVQRSLS